MRRINDPLALRDYLSRLTSEPLTPAQARLLLASRGVRAQQKALEAALRLMKAPSRRARLRPLDDLPLTPKERAIMERLREERGLWSAQMLQERKKKPRPGRQG